MTIERGDVAVTLDPSGLLEFRQKGQRTRFFLPVGAAFVAAVGRKVAAERAAKATLRTQRAVLRRGAEVMTGLPRKGGAS